MARVAKGKAVGRADELTHGTTKKFILSCRGNTVQGVLVCYKENIFAYVNRCCHIPLSMDWMDNRFFSDDKRYLICANHGATYEPSTGQCVWGPCFGEALVRIPVQIKDGRIIAFCPKIQHG